jgi:pectinesterase
MQGEYSTIGAAVNALPNDTSTQTVFIYPGTYPEQVNVSRVGPTTVSMDSSMHDSATYTV